MLRANLSTRPFYNDRLVRIGIAVAVLLLAAFTTFNAFQVLSLNARNSEMSGRAQQAEAQTTQYRERARALTQAMDKVEVTAVQDAARIANGLIDRRAFSWTDLFNRFERTLPPDVRIASVEPQIDRDGRLLIAISTVSRRVEDLHEFIDQLEVEGGLRDVIARNDVVEEDGSTRSMIQGYYDEAAVAKAATTPPAASDSSSMPANGSAAAPNASPSTPSAPAPPVRPGPRSDGARGGGR
jgi:hypothetical protein